MILIEEVSREWERDGEWRIAPAGMGWIEEGSLIVVGKSSCIGHSTIIGNLTRIDKLALISNLCCIGDGATISYGGQYRRRVQHR